MEGHSVKIQIGTGSKSLTSVAQNLQGLHEEPSLRPSGHSFRVYRGNQVHMKGMTDASSLLPG